MPPPQPPHPAPPPAALSPRCREAVEHARDAVRGGRPWPVDPEARAAMLNALAGAARAHLGSAVWQSLANHYDAALDPADPVRRLLAAEALTLRAELIAAAYEEAATGAPEGRPTVAEWAARVGLSEGHLRTLRAECAASRALPTRGSGPRAPRKA